MNDEATEELENTITPDVEAAPPADVEPDGETKEALPAGDSAESDDHLENQNNALRRIANKRRKEARLLAKKNAELEAQLAEKNRPQKPLAENYEDYSEYVDAAVQYGVQQQTQPLASDPLEVVRDDITSAGAEKYPDFSEVAFATQPMMEVLGEFDAPEEIVYYMGKNREEAKRIAGLDALGMAREFGKIEAKMSMPKPELPRTPPPITPIGEDTSATVDEQNLTVEQKIARRNKERWAAGKI